MSALPRPDLPPGPHRDLVETLHDLHHRAGWPSLRRLAAEAGCSHTTVSHAFSSRRLPSWGLVEVLVEAMDGDPTDLQDLWLAASTNGTTSGTTAVPAPATPTTAPRIAGRRTELAAVRRHLNTGTGLLLVTGEAGIGKTRLVETALATTDTFVAVGHCLPLSTEVPLMPVIDVLRTVHESDDGQWLKEALAAAPPFVRGGLARLLPDLGEVTAEVDADFSRQHLFAAIIACLRRLATERGLAVLLEDVHWADAATLDLLEYLVTRLDGVPVAATWRTDDAAVTPPHVAWLDRVRRLSSVSAVDLAPLTLEETTEQLRLTADLDDERIRRIHARSGGHPLFTAHLALQGDATTLSPQLADLLDHRLALHGDAARVTAALAVADRAIDADLLGRVAGLDGDRVVTALRELDARHLLSRASHGLARLSHPLLAEAARRRLVPGEGPHLHRRLAEALGDSPDAEPAEVAEHWRSADDPAHELPWRVRAAKQANHRTDPGGEANQWLRALDIARHHEVPHFDRAAAATAAYDALELSGQLEQCLVVAREAAVEVEVEGRTDRTAAEVLRRVAQAEWLVSDDPHVARALVDRTLGFLEDLGPSETVVHALDLRANTCIDDGRYGEAMTDLGRALDVCRELGDDSLFFGVSATLAWHTAHLGDLEQGLEHVRLARERLGASAGPRREAYMAMMHTDMLIQHHRPPEEVEEAARHAIDLGHAWGMDFHLLTVVRANVAESYLDAGRAAEAAARLADVPRSDSYDDWPGLWMAGRLAIVEGHPDEAVRIMQAVAKTGSSPQNALHKMVWIALARLWQGRPAEAWDALRESLDGVHGLPNAADLWLVYTTLARCAADLAARPDRTVRPTVADLQQLRARAVVDPLGPGRAPIARPAATAMWEAELARLGHHDDAATWSRAASLWDGLRRPHDAAYCRWRAAQAALRAGQGTLATRLLTKAAADAREHVPLSRAIAGTASGRSPQGGPGADRAR